MSVEGKRFTKTKRVLATGAALALLPFACSSEGSNTSPTKPEKASSAPASPRPDTVSSAPGTKSIESQLKDLSACFGRSGETIGPYVYVDKDLTAAPLNETVVVICADSTENSKVNKISTKGLLADLKEKDCNANTILATYNDEKGATTRVAVGVDDSAICVYNIEAHEGEIKHGGGGGGAGSQEGQTKHFGGGGGNPGGGVG